jgi:hypothetical protein
VKRADFVKPGRRREWDAETPIEQPFDPGRAVRRFEEANRSLAE